MDEQLVGSVSMLLQDIDTTVGGKAVKPTLIKAIISEAVDTTPLGKRVWILAGVQRERTRILGARTVGDPNSRAYLVTVSTGVMGLTVHYCKTQ